MKPTLLSLKMTLLSVIACVFIGCASSKDANSTEPDRVSNIPWNKPQSWEGGGALGGALGGGR